MFKKISEGEVPEINQYIAFKVAEKVFAGRFRGKDKASPFVMESQEAPIFVIDEWMGIHLWV
jgi:hypothetical protein